MEESNAELDKCMKDWEDLSAEYLVINAVIFHNGSLDVLVHFSSLIKTLLDFKNLLFRN